MNEPENQIATKPEMKPVPKASALTVMASRVNVEPEKLLATLKETVFKKATNNELMALVIVANEYGLNPFLKEIYAFPAKGGGIVPVVGIDGWISMMNRQPEFDGIEFEFVEGKEGKPISCTAIIYLKGRGHHVKLTEYMDECYRNTEPWNAMPRRMIRHKALIQAARVAFGFSGIQDEDEAAITMKSANAHEVAPKAATPNFAPKPEKKVRKAKAPKVEETDAEVEVEPNPAPDAWGTLSVNLADAGIKQEDFVKGLRAIDPDRVPSQAKVVDDLRDDVLTTIAAEGLDAIVEVMKAKGISL